VEVAFHAILTELRGPAQLAWALHNGLTAL